MEQSTGVKTDVTMEVKTDDENPHRGRTVSDLASMFETKIRGTLFYIYYSNRMHFRIA